MKKIGIIFLTVILCFNLTGCGKLMSRGERLTRELGSDQQISDRMMEEIAAALDNGDVEALKSLFSKDALKEVEYMDEQIQDLLDFYQGKKQSFEGNASTSTHTKYGEDIEKQFIGQYLLITDKESYRVLYDYTVIDKNNPDIEGLNQLEIVPDRLYQEDDFFFLSGNAGYEGPGVYLQR